MCFRCYIQNSTHQYLYFYEMTSECWRHSRIPPPARGGERNVARASTIHLLRAKKVSRIDGQHSGSSVYFFFLLSGMMAPHAKSSRHPDISSLDHTTSVTALLSGSCVSTGSEHMLNRTVRRRNHVVLHYLETSCSDLGRAR